jgi:hypothetical protein
MTSRSLQLRHDLFQFIRGWVSLSVGLRRGNESYFTSCVLQQVLQHVMITATCTLHGGVAVTVFARCKIVLQIAPTKFYYLKCTVFFVIMEEEFAQW